MFSFCFQYCSNKSQYSQQLAKTLQPLQLKFLAAGQGEPIELPHKPEPGRTPLEPRHPKPRSSPHSYALRLRRAFSCAPSASATGGSSASWPRTRGFGTSAHSCAASPGWRESAGRLFLVPGPCRGYIGRVEHEGHCQKRGLAGLCRVSKSWL